MSLGWAIGVLVALVVVAVVSFQLGRHSQLRREPPPLRRQHPSVFVDMDDRPPMEIDFDAGIRASQRVQPKNPSKDEA
ncbi:MAG: hypothetical protein NZ849_06755 [Meiothermus sp.]|uniref:hypothetical protein n=1 Tax=Meiothermus sp. TaxID=1955249 RepID=UPI0025F2BEB3|nr:hypothetical protein [Meiothermus sp.]MCS7057845.1 hypothetical protein [Meiothermus sp.]MCS7194592.1 hypothetical protein [Meiothermus sp.]MCX7741074.1 hypothetical protein [Meiothermus sp.]MDW8090787.1 hypothetical protein [Meiothermus sp.]MDW8480790.1 hypothetical protein [Meiothermus sp.]